MSAASDDVAGALSHQSGGGDHDAQLRSLRLILVPIVILVVAGLAGGAFAPALLKNNPLGLIALDARSRNLVLVAERIDLWPYLVVGIGRRVIGDPWFYLLGLWHGDRAVKWVEERSLDDGMVVRWIDKYYRRAAGWFVFFTPGALVCVLAGATGMKPRRFALINVAGTVTMVVLLRVFAHSLDGPIGAVTRFNNRWSKWLTLLTFALVALSLLRRSRSPEGLGLDVEELLDDDAADPEDANGPETGPPESATR